MQINFDHYSNEREIDSNRAHNTLDIESYWMPDSNADWNDWMIGREFSVPVNDGVDRSDES